VGKSVQVKASEANNGHGLISRMGRAFFLPSIKTNQFDLAPSSIRTTRGRDSSSGQTAFFFLAVRKG
jgi:hypothetical protein